MPRRAVRPEAAGPPQLRIDPFRGVPEAKRWRDALVAGRWKPVEEGLAGLVDPERRELVVERLTHDLDRVPALDEWVEATGSRHALLVRGAQGIMWAWAARGRAHVEHVEAQGWPLFFERLRHAERDLFAAAAVDVDDPLPWGRLVLSGRGLEISLAELWARYRRATAGAPFLPIAADQMLQGLCDKWGGSHEAMFEFAVSTSEAAPPGHPVHRVVPMAVIERRAACDGLDQWLVLRDGMPEMQRWLYDAAARSIDLPDFAPSAAGDPQRLTTLNVFAGAFAQMDHIDRLRWTLERIDMELTEEPWALWGGEAEVHRLRQVVNLA